MKHKIFIIAEVGVNHNGDLKIAKKLIRKAKESGANAVKFQTFRADELVTEDAKKALYQIKKSNKNETQYEMLKKLQLSEIDHFKLEKYANSINIEFMSTAFDFTSLKFLSKKLKLKRFKISSSEITNAPLLLQFGKLKKQIILSTGMSNIKEIEDALGVLAFGLLQKENPTKNKFIKVLKSKVGREALKKYVTLLHCTSEYPTDYQNLNLNCIKTLKSKFKLRVGFSDHSEGIIASSVAAALGAEIIEKHITLNKNMIGPDHAASIEPNEFKNMIASIRDVEKILGSFDKKSTNVELENSKVSRKSIFASKDILKGEKFTLTNLIVKRPALGITPFKYWNLLRKKSLKKYKANEKI